MSDVHTNFPSETVFDDPKDHEEYMLEAVPASARRTWWSMFVI